MQPAGGPFQLRRGISLSHLFDITAKYRRNARPPVFVAVHDKQEPILLPEIGIF